MADKDGAEVTPTPEPEVEVKEAAKLAEAPDDVEFYKSKAKAFEREKKALEKRLAEHEQAEESKRQAEMTAQQKAEERAAKAEAELQATKLAIVRRDVAARVGIPASLADRLKGSTEDEIEADAKTLLETLPKAEKSKPSASPTNPSNAQKGETPEDQKRRIGYTRSTDVFGQSFNESKGGGLLINSQE